MPIGATPKNRLAASQVEHSKSSLQAARNPDKSAEPQILSGPGEFLVERPQAASREQCGRQQVSVNPA